jgi:polyvinyl alcohol dehydrogenase (cytochrome)
VLGADGAPTEHICAQLLLARGEADRWAVAQLRAGARAAGERGEPQAAGPGTALGGIEWGTAYDLSRVYVPLADPFGVPYSLAGQTATYAGGSWAALDPQTGKFDWQVPTPGGAGALGPASEANGVVYVGDMAQTGNNMFALNAATGQTLWSFASGGSVNSGPAIVDGTVYWGSGYSHLGPGLGSGNDKFYAFSLGGR